MKRGEQDADALEARARALALAHDAVLLREPGGRILFWSEGAQALYGWSAAEAVGQVSHALLCTELCEGLEQAEAQLEREGSWTGELVHRARSGELLTVHSRWVLSVDGGGQRTVLESNRNISARKAAERRQGETLALLDSILDTAPVGLSFVDRDLRFVRINRLLAAINGVPVEHTVGRTLREVIGDDMADLVEPVYRHVFESGEPVLERELAGSLQGAPQRRAWRVSYYPVRDGGGQVGVVGMVVQDITEALREQERTARLQAATSALSRALTPEDVARVVLGEAVQGLGARRGLAYLRSREDGSLRVLADVGYTEAEPVPERKRVLAPDEPDPCLEVLRTGEPMWLESLEQLQTQVPRFVLLPVHQRSQAWAVLPMMVDGQPVGTLLLSFAQSRPLSPPDRSFLRVLSQQCGLALERARLYREAQSAVQLRDEFLSVASHELKTPLTPLQLKLQQLRREAEGTAPGQLPRTQLLGGLEVAAAQVRRLATLTHNLLDVGRLGEGRLTLQREEVDLAEVVREVCAELVPQAESSASPLQVQADAPVRGRWDRLRLEQVVTNLVSNALKYGAGSAVQVTLRQEGSEAVLGVADRGIGIAPAQLERIFGKFERAVPERQYGGLGLGLYIVQQIVQAHGGRIGVQSQPGAGATFTVHLPLRTPAPPGSVPG
ncbi:MAG TPA: ATP-binding protein [Aggregicoccus sp.]|nr:ATP-binding protein [Aggregicoccus sp.]